MKNRQKYNIVFITTFIDRKNIDNLIDSVSNNNFSLSIFFILINQTVTKLDLPISNFIEFYEIRTDRLSLSKARNIGINYLLENKINFQHIMFPDDDTTFDISFFTRYNEFIKLEQNYLIDVFCEGSDKLFKKNKYKNGVNLKKPDYEVAMSVNMIIDRMTLFKTGQFDERMGVGAKYGAGEDNDYFIRICELTNKGFIYVKSLYNFHPSNPNKFSKMKLKDIIVKYIKYGNGSIFMLCKHQMYKKALKICFRALAGALISFIKLDFKRTIAFIIVFFSRLKMFFKCLWEVNFDFE